MQIYLVFTGKGNDSACLTVAEKPCDIPFEYNGNYYDRCIDVDNGGDPWCYVNSTTKSWQNCDMESCSGGRGQYFAHYIYNHIRK